MKILAIFAFSAIASAQVQMPGRVMGPQKPPTSQTVPQIGPRPAANRAAPVLTPEMRKRLEKALKAAAKKNKALKH